MRNRAINLAGVLAALVFVFVMSDIFIHPHFDDSVFNLDKWGTIENSQYKVFGVDLPPSKVFAYIECQDTSWWLRTPHGIFEIGKDTADIIIKLNQ